MSTMGKFTAVMVAAAVLGLAGEAIAQTSEWAGRRNQTGEVDTVIVSTRATPLMFPQAE